MSTATHSGSVKAIIFERGFGFLRYAGGEIFFHVRDLDPALEFDDRLIERGVTFAISTDPRSGRPRAVNVRGV